MSIDRYRHIHVLTHMFTHAYLQIHTYTYAHIHMYVTYTSTQHPPTQGYTCTHTHTVLLSLFSFVRAIFLGKISFFSFKNLIRWDEIKFLLKEKINSSIVAALTSLGRKFTVG